MKKRSSVPRRGSQLAALHIVKEAPQLVYQILGFLGLKENRLVAATAALHAALVDADTSVIGEINLESESRSASVVNHGDVVLEMRVSKDGRSTVVIKSEDPRDTVRMLLGRGGLDFLENVRSQATAKPLPADPCSASRACSTLNG